MQITLFCEKDSAEPHCCFSPTDPIRILIGPDSAQKKAARAGRAASLLQQLVLTYADGTSTATCLPLIVPLTLKLPTGGGAWKKPVKCNVPPVVPGPLTVMSATMELS